MEATHIQKFIHTSPRKIRLVADMIRSMGPLKALDILRFTRKNASEEVSKAIKTTIANSKQKGMNQDALAFKIFEINESTRMRRFKAGTRGRAKSFKRRMSHIKIVLSDQVTVDSKRKGGSKRIERSVESIVKNKEDK